MKKYSQDLDEYPMQVWGGEAPPARFTFVLDNGSDTQTVKYTNLNRRLIKTFQRILSLRKKSKILLTIGALHVGLVTIQLNLMKT